VSRCVTLGGCLFFYTWGMRSRNLAVVFAGLLVFCGGSGDALAPEAGDRVAGLRVTVRPEGSAGPEWVPRVECAVLGEEAIDPRCRVLGGLGPGDLDPGPRRAACAQVYGGPGTAQVTGSLGACTCRPSSTWPTPARSPAGGATSRC
jgi:hypothetical protein